MSAGNAFAEEVLDLGSRLFIAGVFLALGVAALLAIVGTGLSADSRVLFLGAVNVVLVIFWAGWAYAGNRLWPGILWAWLAVLAIVAVIALAAVRGTAGAFLAANVLVPAVLAFFLYGLRSVRAFVAVQAGAPIDTLALVAPTDKGTPSPDFAFSQEGNLLTLSEQTRQGVRRLSLLARLGALLLLALAALDLVLGVWLLVRGRGGLALLPLALVSGVVGMVALTLADDLSFLADTKGYEKNHLANSWMSTRILCRVGTVAGAVVLVLVGILLT